MQSNQGHRQRVKARFLAEGLDNFDEVHALELLLFYCSPRIDTKVLAYRLIENFGSFAGVLEASVEDLQKVEGIGPNAASFLTLLNAVNRYYRNDKAQSNEPLKSPEQFCRVLAPKFTGCRKELVYLLCLDAQCRMICCRSVPAALFPKRRFWNVWM